MAGFQLPVAIRSIDPGGVAEVLTPWKYVGGVRVFWSHPLKCHILSFKTLAVRYNSASFTSSGMKELVQKWKVKLIFQCAYRLSGTGIVECLEIIDVGCNLKQFDGLTGLTLIPDFTTDLCHWLLLKFKDFSRTLNDWCYISRTNYWRQFTSRHSILWLWYTCSSIHGIHRNSHKEYVSQSCKGAV